MKIISSKAYTIAAFALLLLMLLSFRTKPLDLLDREKNRSLNLQSTDVGILRQEAFADISDNDRTRIQILEAQLSEMESGSEKIELLKELSSTWYSIGELGIAGGYAEEVAVLEESAEAWGIAGTTFGLCVRQTDKDKERSFCLNKALESLENAISLDPDELAHQINRAVLLAENPPSDQPMRGVQLLLEMNKKFPKNVSVINNIAKFALQTNQLERAEQRLLGALSLEPDNISTNCLLAQLYNRIGDEVKASAYEEVCRNR